MKLDRWIIELTALIEKSTPLESYTIIPRLIREEVEQIIWRPTYVKDAVTGSIQSITYDYEIKYYEKA